MEIFIKDLRERGRSLRKTGTKDSERGSKGGREDCRGSEGTVQERKTGKDFTRVQEGPEGPEQEG